MIDKDAVLKRTNETKPAQMSWEKTLSGLNHQELFRLRAQIDALLPSINMSDMNLEEELMIQFQQTKTLLNEILSDDGTPANQKAQVINTCNSILTGITTSQSKLYNAERLKIMEQCLTNALKSSPTEVADKFFENYERELKVLEVRT